MKTKKTGFTLIELLIVVAIVAILAGMIMVGISSAQSKAKRAATQQLISAISNSIEQYKMITEQGYPPNDAPGVALSGTISPTEGIDPNFTYRLDVIIPFLDGEVSATNPGPQDQFFSFPKKNRMKGNDLVCVDPFNQPLWYRNFTLNNPKLKARVIEDDWPLHPWYNIYNFKGFQIYSKADSPDDAYGGRKSRREKYFQWLTNYQ